VSTRNTGGCTEHIHIAPRAIARAVSQTSESFVIQFSAAILDENSTISSTSPFGQMSRTYHPGLPEKGMILNLVDSSMMVTTAPYSVACRSETWLEHERDKYVAG
jgi:hypothetical protein